jgi:hypothetical protein
MQKRPSKEIAPVYDDSHRNLTPTAAEFRSRRNTTLVAQNNLRRLFGMPPTAEYVAREQERRTEKNL